MCCGSRRSAWRSASARSRASPPTRPMPQGVADRAGISGAIGPDPVAPAGDVSAGPPFATVAVRYMETAAIRVQGPITGRHYDFSGAQPVQAVDFRDAAIFTRSSPFRRSALHETS